MPRAAAKDDDDDDDDHHHDNHTTAAAANDDDCDYANTGTHTDATPGAGANSAAAQARRIHGQSRVRYRCRPSNPKRSADCLPA